MSHPDTVVKAASFWVLDTGTWLGDPDDVLGMAAVCIVTGGSLAGARGTLMSVDGTMGGAAGS